jgi:elongation factor G
MRAFYFDGLQGEIIREEDIPERYLEESLQYRKELIETIANLDPEIEDLFLSELPISV